MKSFKRAFSRSSSQAETEKTGLNGTNGINGTANGVTDAPPSLPEVDREKHGLVEEPAAMKAMAAQEDGADPTNEDDVATAATTAVTDGHLSPLHIHYLKKALIALQMQREGSGLDTDGALGKYGKPFAPGSQVINRKKNAINRDGLKEEPIDPPILRFLFRNFLWKFPYLADVKPTFWTDRIQPAWDDFAARDFSSTRERAQITKRRIISVHNTLYLGKLVNSGLKIKDKGQHLVLTQEDFKLVDSLVADSIDAFENGFWVGVVKVDRIPAKAAEQRPEENYTIYVREQGKSEAFVTRSYQSFVEMHKWLSTNFPHEALPTLPKALTVHAPMPRAALQCYLRAMLTLPVVATSQRFRDFLTLKPVILNPEEASSLQSKAVKQEKDAAALWHQAGLKARGTRKAWRQYTHALVYEGEMNNSWEQLRTVDAIGKLPENYKRIEVTARLFVANMLHYLLVRASNSAEMFALLKGIHELIPWFAVKQAVKIADPATMVKAIVNIFFGQPFGAKSLVQRIASAIFSKEMDAIKKNVATLNEKISNGAMSSAVKNYVYSDRVTREKVRMYSTTNNEDILVSIFAAQNHSSTDAIKAAYAEYRQCIDQELKNVKDGDEVPTSSAGESVSRHTTSQGTVFQSLKVLLREHERYRDREQILEVIYDKNIPLLAKEAIAVFYKLLSQMSKFCNLPKRIDTLQKFLDDLVITVQSTNRHHNRFVELAERHEESLWMFLHEMHHNSVEKQNVSMLKDLIDWCALGLSWFEKGVSAMPTTKNNDTEANLREDKLDLNALLASAKDPAAVQKEVEDIVKWHKYIKIRYHVSLRVRLSGRAAEYLGGGEETMLRKLLSGIGEDEWYRVDPTHKDSNDDVTGTFLSEPDGDLSYAPEFYGGSAAVLNSYSTTNMERKPVRLAHTRELLPAFVSAISMKQ